MNHILSALNSEDRQALTSAGRRMTFRGGQPLFKARDPIADVLFPISGVISAVVILKDGDEVETALVGCRGVAGSCVAFSTLWNPAGSKGVRTCHPVSCESRFSINLLPKPRRVGGRSGGPSRSVYSKHRAFSP